MGTISVYLIRNLNMVTSLLNMSTYFGYIIDHSYVYDIIFGLIVIVWLDGILSKISVCEIYVYNYRSLSGAGRALFWLK